MKKIRLQERELINIINKVVNEQMLLGPFLTQHFGKNLMRMNDNKFIAIIKKLCKTVDLKAISNSSGWTQEVIGTVAQYCASCCDGDIDGPKGMNPK